MKLEQSQNVNTFNILSFGRA